MSSLLGTDVGLGVSIELLALGNVEVQRVGPGDGEEGKRDTHGLSGSDEIGDVSKDDRADGATADGGDEEGGTALGVATETTEGEGEDDGEDAGLEEEDDVEHADTAPVGGGGAARVGANGGGDEDHDEGLEGEEHVTGLTAKVHDTGGGEATDGEERLGNGVEVGALVVALGDAQLGRRLSKVVDVVGCASDLASNVRELCKGSPEKSVLLAERLVDVAVADGGRFLLGHVAVRDLGNVLSSEEEDKGEDGNEDGDGKVHVLYSLEGLSILSDVLEDDLGSEDGRNDGANSLDGLRQLKTELGPLGGTADGNVWVGADFKSRQTRSGNEHGSAETTE